MQVETQTETIISYGINKNYLQHWNIYHALREIFQNFMDYGEYNLEVIKGDVEEKSVQIKISNTFNPENLEFLSIGMSKKSDNSRGKYGEGLKMAFLIFCRENLPISLITNYKYIRPLFQKTEIGLTFGLEISYYEPKTDFEIIFIIQKDIWEDFYNNHLIKPEDIIFNDNYFGKIVDKPVGSIYCGGLFVSKVDNLTKAYDLNPRFLNLDRDRMTPSSFDVSYYCSKINQAENKFTLKDLTFSDTQYIDKIPERIIKDIKPIIVGNQIEYSYKVNKKTVIIKNESVKQQLVKHNFFSRTLKRLRNYLAKQLGIYDLLVQFRDKYIHDENAKQEFNIILERIEEKL